MIPRSIPLILASALTGACGAGWQRVELTPNRAIAEKQVVEIWLGARREQWHGVWLSEDSISGIPYFQRLDCDSCRRAAPLAAVDSLRCGDPETPGVVAGLTPLLAIVALAIFVHLDGGLK